MGFRRPTHRVLSSGPAPEGTVVMIHGLFMGSFMMVRIAGYFRARNWRVIQYDYPTVRKKIAAHGADLAEFLDSPLFEAVPRIDFVTHSMGGLLLRCAVGLLTGARRKQLGRAVMVAPPNRGSDTAALAVRLVPGAEHIVAPIRDLSSAPDSFANTFPVPDGMPETGIIAASSDRRVSLEYTPLGNCPRIILPGGHSPILFRPETAEQTFRFITSGSFSKE
ncbi:MAG: alpha/beta hydrolase [Lentisphaeria bacterium]|nr:alpha/beta hydrolase [Lentisphaeria bacterium]